MKDYIQFSCEDQIITHFVEVVQVYNVVDRGLYEDVERSY